MASSSSAAAISGAHHRLLLPCSPRRLPRPRPRPRLLRSGRPRLVACHADTLLPSSSPAPATAACASTASANGFSDWLREHGLPPGKVAILDRPVPCFREGKDLPLHYVAAGQDLEAGDVAFEVPMSLVVTLERVLGDESVAELLTTNKLSELACLALYLMYEKKQGQDSFWYPYIKELDRQRGRGQLAVESPLLWSENELNHLKGSPIRDEVIARDEGIRREYNELDTLWFMAGSLFQQYPFDIPTEAFPFEIFKQAFVAVQSCVVHLQKVSLARRFALVPLGPPLLTYKSNCKAMLTAVGDSVRLVVDRPYKAGEPIIVWCGPQPNSRLLLNYGFIDEDNPYDRIASLNTEDPQFQEKRMVAQRNGKLAIQNFHVCVGKEKETIAEMLPYLRLGYISDPDEMQAILSSEGDTCPVSPCTERAVLDQLVGYLESRLADYPTTLDEDDAMLADGNLEPKKEVATRLVRLEKKLLHGCLQAANEFINDLPDHTESEAWLMALIGISLPACRFGD
uniref:Rubisco LSMT substrate-binding domain-containing protein n=1 Tax=Oryza punctata TaxID=4537 RepID=A0A0E0MKY5_ORYPU